MHGMSLSKNIVKKGEVKMLSTSFTLSQSV